MRIARIVVSAASFNIDRPYSYRVPDELRSLQPGMRVTVPFSRSNRTCEGMVLAVSDEERDDQLKSVLSALDSEPVLSREQLGLLLWMRSRCFAPAYDCIHAMLPAGVWYTMKHGCRIADGVEREAAYAAAGRSQLCKSVLDVLYENGGEMLAAGIKEALGREDISAPVKKLTDEGVIVQFSREIRRVKDKTAAVAVLACEPEDALTAAAVKKKKAPMQASVLQLMSAVGSAPVSEITYFTGCSAQTVRSLEKAGYLSIEYVEALRTPEAPAHSREKIRELNEDQKKVFEPLCDLLRSEKPEAALLCGVTGSGKTAVYIKLIEQAVALGKTAIILVPEIVLTPQMVSIFSAHFGDAIAVLHSSLGVGERYDEWKRIRSGEVSVVIGTRSAVFAPLENLGIIIIDEEQEHTYKSENSPRYHARDIAKYRCAHSNALLLLGSATPSLESMYSAQRGIYHLFRLRGRYNKTVLPSVMTADMRSELKDGNDSTISSVLAQEIRSNIERGEQSILFINRRGANSLVACGECGYVQKCPNCSVSMTYHSANK
ncbi:MAG: primosomal protein N', partial [Oscillospiraceae bacterium]|nr:primosomal protein N' [Oscillospiraceae bacterium]